MTLDAFRPATADDAETIAALVNLAYRAGKRMLAEAEAYAVRAFGVAKFVMVVLSSRAELIEFYLRRGYRRTGATADYPLDAGAGVPKRNGLRIETLEKPVGA